MKIKFESDYWINGGIFTVIGLFVILYNWIEYFPSINDTWMLGMVLALLGMIMYNSHSIKKLKGSCA